MGLKKRARRARPAAGEGRRVRYAVVGLGYIAQVAVLPAFAHARENSELVALVSDDPEKLEKMGRKYRVRHRFDYDSFETGLRDAEVDAVYIALPNHLHREYTERAAAAGVHVLCEKPMAVSEADCRAMIAACDRHGVKLMIAYRLHFDEANMRAVDLVQSGQLGDVRMFNSVFTMQVKEGDIRLNPRAQGGGTLYDIGIYCINAARYVLGDEPTQVWATAVNSGDRRFREVPETVHAVMKFEDDRLATFVCSFGTADRSRYEVVGTKGAIVMDPAYEYAEGLAYELTIGEKKKRKQFRKSDQFAPELLHFSECVLRNKEPEPSGKEGLIDVRIIEAIHASMRSGRWEDVRAPERERRPTLRQEIRRPGVQKPDTVNVQQPH